MNSSKLIDSFKGKKVLITGHTGFKGSWLTAWLNQLGANVVGVSLDIPTKPAHFEILDFTRTDPNDTTQRSHVFKVFNALTRYSR